MFSKRGDSQVDWAISMSIFILALALFVIYVKPMLNQEQQPDYFTILMDKIDQELYWQVDDYPIIIQSDYNLSNEPISVEYPLTYNKSYILMPEKSFLVDNNLWFVADLNNGSTRFDLIHSGSPYAEFEEDNDLFTDNESATTSEFTVKFLNYVPSKLSYKEEAVSDLRIMFDGAEPSKNSSYDRSATVARYESVDEELGQIQTYVFSGSSRIYSYITPTFEREISFEMVLHNFSDYYIDNLDNSQITYPDFCVEKTNSLISFSDSGLTLLFAFDRNATFSFCTDNRSINFNINLTADNLTLFKLFLIDGQATSFNKYLNPYTAKFGFNEKLSGLSLDKITTLSNLSYSKIKQDWGAGDFKITVYDWNSTSLLSFGQNPYTAATVYSKDLVTNVLFSNGTSEKGTLNVRAWS